MARPALNRAARMRRRTSKRLYREYRRSRRSRRKICVHHVKKIKMLVQAVQSQHAEHLCAYCGVWGDRCFVPVFEHVLQWCIAICRISYACMPFSQFSCTKRCSMRLTFAAHKRWCVDVRLAVAKCACFAGLMPMDLSCGNTA